MKNKTQPSRNFVSILLNSDLLKYFEYKGICELCDVKSKETYYQVFLKEIAKLPYGKVDSNIEFIGHLSPITMQDMSMNGKSVLLNIILKGWLNNEDKQKLLISKYPFFTEDLIFTKQLFEKYELTK